MFPTARSWERCSKVACRYWKIGRIQLNESSRSTVREMSNRLPRYRGNRVAIFQSIPKPRHTSCSLDKTKAIREPDVQVVLCNSSHNNLNHSSRGKASPVSNDIGERSEEHTSELQSRRDLVCRLLLEKKNYQTSIITFG